MMKQNRAKIIATASLDGIFTNMQRENKQAVVLGVTVLLVGFVMLMIRSAISIWKSANSVVQDDKTSIQKTHMVYSDLIVSVLSCIVFIALTVISLAVNQKLIKQV